MQRKNVEPIFQAKNTPDFCISSFPFALFLIFYNITCLSDQNKLGFLSDFLPAHGVV